MKNEAIKIRLEEEVKAELATISSTLDRPISQIVREAVRDKIAELKKTHPLLAEPKEEIAVQI